jgi:hypothetical protein
MSSKRHTRRSMHEGKKAYDTMAEAGSVAWKMHHRYDAPFEAYKCKVCQKFHVGHSTHRAKMAALKGSKRWT